ncbi:protein canopy 4 [Maniola hyperantus]|uniref:protein canopy 4 n=1 Tax=Aphantopus hyperantus TaxID=2795564 RepID=UPI0015680004|nr:protein canopy 4 [Maniola hyperantus]
MFFDKIILLVVCATSILCSRDVEVKTEEDLGVKYANRCEVCKVLATELQSRLEETGKVHDVIEIGYSLDDVQPKKKTKYQKSELRLIESIDGVCDRILEYNIHKERQDSSRFAKGMSQTFKTLHGLVDKGVKVDLGIPYELWDKPSAEITHMKTQCESLLEDNEEAIEYWYWNLQGTKDLKLHLCSDHALKDTDKSCLFEDESLKGDRGGSTESDNKEKPKLKDASPKSSELRDKKKLNSEQVKPVEMENILDSEDDLDEERLLDGEDDNNNDDYQVPKQKTVDRAEKKRPRNKYIEESLSNKPSQGKLENNKQRAEQSDSYRTEPTEYVKKQLQEEEMLKKITNEAEINIPLKNEEVWVLENELRSEREEL